MADSVAGLGGLKHRNLDKTQVAGLMSQYNVARSEAQGLAAQVSQCCKEKRTAKAFVQFLKGHSDSEPSIAICDSFLYVPFENFLAKGPASKDHGLLKYTEGCRDPGSGKVNEQERANTFGSLEVPTPYTKRQDHPTLANVIETCSQASSFIYSYEQHVPAVPDASALLLPYLICEYKKRDDSEMKAFNQARSYLVSAVTFLKDQGLTDHPVYGLATNGPKGGVLMAWFCPKNEVFSSGFYPQLLPINFAENLHHRTRHRDIRHF